MATGVMLMALSMMKYKWFSEIFKISFFGEHFSWYNVMKTNYQRAERLEASSKKIERLAANGRKMSKTPGDEKITNDSWLFKFNIINDKPQRQ